MTTITLDRNATIDIAAKIKITVDPPPAAGPMVRLTATYGGITSTMTGAKSMAYILPADKQIKLQVGYVDADGNAAAVDGAVQWSSSNEDVASAEVLGASDAGVEGGLVMLHAGMVGVAQISVVADADRGTGSQQITTLLDVEVVAGQAVAGTISPVGEQEPQG